MSYDQILLVWTLILGGCVALSFVVMLALFPLGRFVLLGYFVTLVLFLLPPYLWGLLQ